VAFQLWEIEVSWWGNDVLAEGCDGSGSCTLLKLPKAVEGQPKPFFGPTEWS